MVGTGAKPRGHLPPVIGIMVVMPENTEMQNGGCTVIVTVWGTNVVRWNGTQRWAVEDRESPSMLGVASATVSPSKAAARSGASDGSDGGISEGGMGGITGAPSFGFSSGAGHGAGGHERRPQARSCPRACTPDHISQTAATAAKAYFVRRTKPIVSSMIP